MYNYTITKFSCADVFRWCFCAGVCLGGVIGLLLGLLDKSIGLSGGMFFGLLLGLFSGFFAMLYAAVFNILSPHIGGLSVRLEPNGEEETAGDQAPPGSEEEPANGPDSITSPVKDE